MNVNINFKEKVIKLKKYNGDFYSFLDRLREMLGEDLSGWKLEIGKNKKVCKSKPFPITNGTTLVSGSCNIIRYQAED